VLTFDHDNENAKVFLFETLSKVPKPSNGYWPKLVRLNDNFVYLIGGVSTAHQFIENPKAAPESFLTLVGTNKSNSYVYDQVQMTEQFRMYPACALHKKSNSLFIIGGYKNGLWVTLCNKISFTEKDKQTLI
jgi:hypothetical protein